MRGSALAAVLIIGAGPLSTAAQSVPERRLQAAEALRPDAPGQALRMFRGLVAEWAGRPETVALEARAWRAIGEIYASRNEPGEAAAAFRESLRLDGSQAAVPFELGLAESRLGDHAGAAAEIQTAVERGFRNGGSLYRLIVEEFASRQFSAALERCDELMAMGSQAPELMLRLGRLLFARLYYNEADRAFQIAQRAAPEAFEPRFYLALTRFLGNRFQDTIELLTPLRNRPQGGELLALLGSAQAQSGESAAAEATLRDAMARDPQSPHAVLNLALIMLQQERLEDAASLLDRLLSMPTAGGAKVFFTVSRNGCDQLAREAADRPDGSGARDPRAAAYEQLAAQLQARYHYASAVELLRMALKRGRASASLLYEAGSACLNLDAQSPAAVALLRRSVDMDPRRSEAWHMLGRAYTRQGRFSEAVEALRKAVELRPNALYYTSLGIAYTATESRDPAAARGLALASFATAARLDPHDAVPEFELGRAYLHSGQPGEARSHLLAAIRIEPDFFEAYYALAQSSARLGKPAESREYLAQFRKRQKAARGQAVLGAGLSVEGREP